MCKSKLKHIGRVSSYVKKDFARNLDMKIMQKFIFDCTFGITLTKQTYFHNNVMAL